MDSSCKASGVASKRIVYMRGGGGQGAIKPIRWVGLVGGALPAHKPRFWVGAVLVRPASGV